MSKRKDGSKPTYSSLQLITIYMSLLRLITATRISSKREDDDEPKCEGLITTHHCHSSQVISSKREDDDEPNCYNEAAIDQMQRTVHTNSREFVKLLRRPNGQSAYGIELQRRATGAERR